jgi:hypothetical protein
MWPAGLTPLPQLVFIPPSAAGLSVELRGEAGRRYELQSSDDLLDWVPGETLTLNSDGRLILSLDDSAQARFLRLRTLE